jgi:hypothetical protein
VPFLSSRRKRDGDCVTREECSQISGHISEEVNLVLDAIRGKDLRGGLVADIANIQKDMVNIRNDVANMRKEVKDVLDSDREKKALSTRWKIAIACSLISSGGVVLAEYIHLLIGH